MPLPDIKTEIHNSQYRLDWCVLLVTIAPGDSIVLASSESLCFYIQEELMEFQNIKTIHSKRYSKEEFDSEHLDHAPSLVTNWITLGK